LLSAIVNWCILLFILVKLADNAKLTTSHLISVKEVTAPCYQDAYENIKHLDDSSSHRHVRSPRSVERSDVATLTGKKQSTPSYMFHLPNCEIWVEDVHAFVCACMH